MFKVLKNYSNLSLHWKVLQHFKVEHMYNLMVTCYDVDGVSLNFFFENLT